MKVKNSINIFDFNVHLPPFLDKENVNKTINQDLKLTEKDLIKGLETHKDAILSCDGVNFLLFNTELLDQDISSFAQTAESLIKYVKYTALVDFRRKDIEAYLDKCVIGGVNAIMFNSYLQKISESDFADVLKVCRCAAKKNLIVCVDGSYGTSKMYKYDNLRLACFLSDFIKDVPIVIVHSGGYRVLEAMLLALDKPNIWLDTSFSLPYYIGSSIETDYAFMLRKMNFSRVLFGSDTPYVSLGQAILSHNGFFNRHKFSQEEIEKLMIKNALELFRED